MRWGWIGAGLVVALLLVGWVIGSRDSNSLKAWCRNDIHIGENLTAVKMRTPVSVSDGVWQYTDGVSVSFIDGRVYVKNCG